MQSFVQGWALAPYPLKLSLASGLREASVVLVDMLPEGSIRVGEYRWSNSPVPHVHADWNIWMSSGESVQETFHARCLP